MENDIINIETIKKNPNTMISLRKTTAKRLMDLKQVGDSYDDVINKILDGGKNENVSEVPSTAQ